MGSTRRLGRERRLKGQFGTWWVSHGGYPREKHAGSSLAQVGRVQEGSQGWEQPRGGHQHTGKPPGQGFKQDREGRGAGFQSEQVGWP